MRKTVRPLVENELKNVVDYFLALTPEDDKFMGTDRSNLPDRNTWVQMLIDDSKRVLSERHFYYLGFYLDNNPIGHSGINKIKIGEEAYIHFHLWSPEIRKKGLGSFYLKEALQHYFEIFNFKKLICEPNTINLASNKTLLKCGFTFCDTYKIKPSIISVEHDVNRYELIRPL